MKNKLITYVFIIIITMGGVASIITPDREISFSERRNLYSFSNLNNSEEISGDFEKYVLDHFVFRDLFRKVKAFGEYNLFKKIDNNGLYKYQDYIIKQLYPLNEASVERLADKINTITGMYSNGNSVFYSLIPDKNYFVNDEEYLRIDYEKMAELLRYGIDEDISYINLFDSLELGDYYKTDHHFRIDGLADVLTSLGNALNIELQLDDSDYLTGTYYPFYGAYYGQAAMNIDADTLIYYKNNLLNNCSVKIWESFDLYTDHAGIYDYDSLGSIDSYDVFLYGTKPVVTIENPEAENDTELIIFKDSFANSLTPLLISAYSKITLIDLRLVNHTVLDSFVDFENADILFLYSTMIVNDSYILK